MRQWLLEVYLVGLCGWRIFLLIGASLGELEVVMLVVLGIARWRLGMGLLLLLLAYWRDAEEW